MDSNYVKVLLAATAPKIEPSEDQLRSLFRWKYRDTIGPVFECASKEEIDELVLEYHAENAGNYAKKLLRIIYPHSS